MAYGADVLKPYLTNLFNCKYATQWWEAIITTLHKKGGTGDLNNYRSISLLSVFSKIFTSIPNTAVCQELGYLIRWRRYSYHKKMGLFLSYFQKGMVY